MINKLGFTKKSFWLVCIILIVILFLIKMIDDVTLAFPIRRVIVKGNLTYINRDQLIFAIRPLVKNHDFFNVNLYHIKDAVSGEPWINDVQVQRIWPDTIVIRIYVNRPQAIWQKIGVVNRYGEVFYPSANHLPSHLPYFSVVGPKSSLGSLISLQMLMCYRHISKALMPLGLHITKMQLNLGQFWQLHLDNGMELRLDKQDMLTNLHHFVTVYSKIFAFSKRRALIIDLRYARGMAVHWSHGEDDQKSTLRVASEKTNTTR